GGGGGGGGRAPPQRSPARRSDRRHGAEDVVVAGRGRVPRDLGECVHEGIRPGVVGESAPLAQAGDAAGTRRPADGLVVGDRVGGEGDNAGRGVVEAVEDAAPLPVPAVRPGTAGATLGQVVRGPTPGPGGRGGEPR